MISLPLNVTDHHACSYLKNTLAQTAFVHPSFQLTSGLYSRLIQQGFRRSGNEVYTPLCKHCQQCIPVRIPVDQFQINRNQKRSIKKNLEIQTCIKPASFDSQHYQLYSLYQQNRHPESSMANASSEDYINFLACEWCTTLFVEFLIADKLAAVAVVDLLDNALSAVYTFFDPQHSARSLGTYAVLWQIEYARQLKMDYLYLGYWIKECKKMSYKDQYRPLYGFIDKQWQQIVI